MAIYIEESFFRPIFALRPQGQNRALFIPAANAVADQLIELVVPYNQKQTRRFALSDVKGNGIRLIATQLGIRRGHRIIRPRGLCFMRGPVGGARRYWLEALGNRRWEKRSGGEGTPYPLSSRSHHQT